MMDSGEIHIHGHGPVYRVADTCVTHKWVCSNRKKIRHANCIEKQFQLQMILRVSSHSPCFLISLGTMRRQKQTFAEVMSVPNDTKFI